MCLWSRLAVSRNLIGKRKSMSGMWARNNKKKRTKKAKKGNHYQQLPKRQQLACYRVYNFVQATREPSQNAH